MANIFNKPLSRFIINRGGDMENMLADGLDRELNGGNQVPCDLRTAERILSDERARLEHMLKERARIRHEVDHRQAILAQLDLLIQSTESHVAAVSQAVPTKVARSAPPAPVDWEDKLA